MCCWRGRTKRPRPSWRIGRTPRNPISWRSPPERGTSTMRKAILIITITTAVSAVVSAQAPVAPAAQSTLRLTVDDAVQMAVDHNVDLAAARLDPQIGDTRVAAATGAFRPSFSTGFQRNNQLQPPSSFLIPTATRNDAMTSRAGLDQKLPWFGTSYSVSWSTVHTSSNSF